MTPHLQSDMAWDPEHAPQGSGDPETDATPETLLYIARYIWRLFAPDPNAVAAREMLSRAQYKDILFWLAPLEKLVRAILFLLLPPERLSAPAAEQNGQGAATPNPRSSRHRPSSPPPAHPPRFRYWTATRPTPEQTFDFADPAAEAAFAAFIAARQARCAAAAARPPASGFFTAAPIARRMAALLGVLNDPLRHADRLSALMRAHRPVMQFAASRPKKTVSGPRAPCAHALERARYALCRAASPLIGPLRPHWSSG